MNLFSFLRAHCFFFMIATQQLFCIYYWLLSLYKMETKPCIPCTVLIPSLSCTCHRDGYCPLLTSTDKSLGNSVVSSNVLFPTTVQPLSLCSSHLLFSFLSVNLTSWGNTAYGTVQLVITCKANLYRLTSLLSENDLKSQSHNSSSGFQLQQALCCCMKVKVKVIQSCLTL